MTTDFAVVKINNKQELVRKNEEILVQKIDGEPKTKLTFDQVLLVHKSNKTEIGAPVVKNAKVEAQIVEQTKGPKVEKMTYKSKARERRHVGHRQQLTKIKILSI